MNCPNCHHDNPPGAKFCRECGHRQPAGCPSCGAPYETGQKFCLECGAKVGVPTPSSVPSAPASYTPKHLAEKILTSRSALEGERKQVTVLFCDIANSTPLAARIGEETMHGLLNRFFGLAMEAVHRYEGTINQFLGDGFMALFGAPVAHEDHARRAALAALEIRRTLSTEGGLGLPLGETLNVRMGLNTGPVVVGSIGDNLRMDYTAIGDTTNLAARLQQNADPGIVLVSDSVARLVRGYVTLEAIPPLMVKGKDEPILAHRLLAAGTRRSRLAEDRVLSPFVGRDREISVLYEALSDVRSGHGQVVSIVGEPGVGKSRVLHELHAGLSGRDIAYFEAWCQSFGQAMPYLPMQDLLRSRFSINEADDAEQVRQKIHADLVQFGLDPHRHTPYLLQLLGVKAGTQALAQLSPETIKGRTLDTLLQLVLSRAQQGTVVLAIEDLHWIDKSSEEFLATLADSLSGVPILLVTTARPGYTPPWIGKSYATQVALRVLANDAARSIVEASVQRAPLTIKLTNAILEKAEGNPLFLEELTLAASAQDSLGTIQAMPNTIQGVLASRIDRLQEGAKRTLQAASVLGREFSLELLQAITGQDVDVTRDLATLKHEEFIFERPAPKGTVYVFKHVLTQEVAYDSVLSAKRQVLHEMAARAVEQMGADRIEEHYELLAHHYSRSANAEKAIDYLELANQKAIKANAGVDAQTHFETALPLYSKLPDTRENRRRKLRSLLLQLPVYLLQLKLAQYEELLRAHEVMAQGVDDDGLLGRLYGCLGTCEWFFGRLDAAFETGRKAAALCEKTGEMAGAAHAYVFMQWTALHKGDFQIATDLEARALQALAATPNLRFYLWSLTCSAWALSFKGQFDLAIEKSQLVMAEGEKASDASIVCQCWWTMGNSFLYRGHVDKAVEYIQRAIEMGPTPADKAWAQICLGWALCRRSPESSIHLLESLAAVFQGAGQVASIAWNGVSLGQAYWRTGRQQDALRTLNHVVEISNRSGMKHWEGYAHRLLGEMDLEQDDTDALKSAQSRFEKARSLFEICGAEPDLAKTYTGLGQILLREGKPIEARNQFTAALEIFERLGMAGEPERVRKLIEEIPAT